MKFPGGPLRSTARGLTIRRWNIFAPKSIRNKLDAILSWKHVPLCVLAMAVLAMPIYAQRSGTGGGGTHTSPGRTTTGVYSPGLNRYPTIGPTWQPLPDAPPIPKPTMADDDKCFPWNLSEVHASSVSVARLKVPSKARSEFEKACTALSKSKFEEAEQHARGAIDKSQSYAAAWVMLGVTLEGQHKSQDAGDACSHAVTIDAAYLPAYLCKAEFAVRDQLWKQVLDIADMAQGLNSGGDAYVHYYRGMAYLHLNNLVEAKKSALQAMEIDINHHEPSVYFLLAQIYDHEGDNASAITKLHQFMKYHSDRIQEDEAKQYLAKLESQQSAK